MKTAQHTKHLQQYLQAQQAEMIGFLEKLVLAESPTNEPQAQKMVMDLLKCRFQALGFQTSVFPGKHTGGYLYARPANHPKGQAIQLLIGHCDTVWPLGTLATMPLQNGEQKLKGPGVYDMKAGLTQIIFALKAIKDLELPLAVTPVVLINSDEETGSRESTLAIRRLARLARRAYILEPPLGLEGKLKTARKGLGRFTIHVTGKPAHAGLEPGKGASAILELSHQIQQLFALNDPEKGITVNVGLIEGGTRANVVAPMGKAVADVRVCTRKDAALIRKKIYSLQALNPETEVRIEGDFGRPPMERNERNQKLWMLASSLGKTLGLNLEQAMAGGGSDGNTTSLFTATLDGLGTVGNGAHAHHEFIFTDTMVERTALLTLLLLAEG